MLRRRLQKYGLPVVACVCMAQLNCLGTLGDHPVQGAPAVAAVGAPAQSPNMPATAQSPSDSPSADARAFYGAPRCGDANVAVCDSFEVSTSGASALDGNIWDVETSGPDARVQLDTTHAARGASAVHVHTPARGYQHAMLSHAKLFPVPDNTFYGRAFVYIDRPPDVPGDAAPTQHFSLFVASGGLHDVPTYVRYGGEDGLLEASYVGNGQVQHAGAPMADGTWIDTTAVPTGRWTCMEWQFKGSANEMRFWLDGTDVPRLAVIGQSNECCRGQVWAAPEYDRVALGWEIYGNGSGSGGDAPARGYDVWLDEIALDTQRIGCAR